MTNRKTQPQPYNRPEYSNNDIFQQSQDERKPQILSWDENTYIANPNREEYIPIDQSHSNGSSPKDQGETKKSINHNFQKHAVVTIKKLLRMKYDFNASEPQQLAYSMWNIFMSSGLKNKKILIILFGEADLQDQGFLGLVKKGGFKEILQSSQETIRKAQQILRNKFLEEITEEVVERNLLNCRNIKLSNEFLIYFKELLTTIKEGPLTKRRMNDKTAKKIEALIKADKQSSKNNQY